MTPKEKALELCNKFIRTYKTHLDPPFVTAREEAKENALIAVDEILYVLDHLRLHEDDEHWFGYFVKVREELEKKRP